MNKVTAEHGIVKPNGGRYGIRAPKGGCTVNGRVFKGGQFCFPFDPANPHGKPVEDGPAPKRVSINGFVYTAREIPAGECGTVAVRMHRIDTNHTYDVIRNHFGEVTCDCPDYEFRRVGTGQMCKHGAKLVELGVIPAPSHPEPEPAWHGNAMFAWARDRGVIREVASTGRRLGFGGYIRMWSAEQATAVYFALDFALDFALEVATEGGSR